MSDQEECAVPAKSLIDPCVRVRTALVAVAAVTALLAGCSTTGFDRPTANLDQLEREGKLAAVFDELLADKPLLVKLPIIGSGKKEQLATIGDRLARTELARLAESLKALRLASGVLPSTVISDKRPEGEKLKRWSETRYREWGTLLANEAASTRKAIDLEKAKLEKIPPSDVLGRVAVSSAVAALSGAGSAEEAAHRQLVDDTKHQLHSAGTKALRDKATAVAEKAFTDLLTLDPAYQGAPRMLILTRLQSIEREFREPRGDESVEQAFKQLQTMHREGQFKDLAKEVEPVALDVRTYYQTLGAAALAEDRLADADRLFRRARSVPGVAADAPGIAEEAPLVDKVRAYYEHAQSAGKFGLALAYLKVIETYQAEYPQFNKQLRETREQVLGNAQKRLGISSFGGSADTARLGSAVSAKVAQALVQELPDDIRLIERDQLQAVLREQEILSMQNKASLSIVATDMLVHGTLVEANVETEVKAGRQVKRVKTGETSKPNPAWLAWGELPAFTREKTARPAELLIEPVMEDVAINVGVHRKRGALSVAFKLIDSASGNVLFSRSETVRRTAESESSDAVQLGSFMVPMRVADLPSDNEMLGTMVDEVAKLVATALAERLKDQEKEYARLAQRHVSEENHVEAAELYAFAVLLGELKKLDVAEFLEAMRRQALEAKFSG